MAPADGHPVFQVDHLSLAYSAGHGQAAIRAGLVYQRFLDAIEPSEHVYHRDDVEPALQRTERLLLAAAGR
jgi:hypothetical protein